MLYVFLEYRPHLAPLLERLYEGYILSSQGLPSLPASHWEALFLRGDIDARQDVIIDARENTAGAPEILAFSWIHGRTSSDRAFLRGPYLSPDNPNLAEIISGSVAEAISRAASFGRRFLEARSVNPAWSDALANSGFTKTGVYERWRLFPLRGSVAVPQAATTLEIRKWVGKADLEFLMGLFNETFSSHWDYSPPVREKWEEVFEGPEFDPRLALLATRLGERAAYAFGEAIDDPWNPGLKASYLISIAVSPKLRNSGYGGVMLSKWLRAGYDAGARAAELDVDSENHVAKSLYRRFGFQHVRSEEVWRYYFGDADR